MSVTNEQVLAGARWLCEAIGWVPYDKLDPEDTAAVLRWTRGVLDAAAPAPPSPAADKDLIWRAIVEASSA